MLKGLVNKRLGILLTYIRDEKNILLIITVSILFRLLFFHKEAIGWVHAEYAYGVEQNILPTSNYTLYFLIGKIFNILFPADFALNIISFVFGIVNILLIYILTSKLFDVRTGTLSALFFSLTAPNILSSLVQRNYEIVICFFLLAKIFLIKGRKDEKFLFFSGFFLGCAIGVYNIIFISYLSFLALYFHLFSNYNARDNLKNFLKIFYGGIIIIFPLYFWIYYCYDFNFSEFFKYISMAKEKSSFDLNLDSLLKIFNFRQVDISKHYILDFFYLILILNIFLIFFDKKFFFIFLMWFPFYLIGIIKLRVGGLNYVVFYTIPIILSLSYIISKYFSLFGTERKRIFLPSVFFILIYVFLNTGIFFKYTQELGYLGSERLERVKALKKIKKYIPKKTDYVFSDTETWVLMYYTGFKPLFYPVVSHGKNFKFTPHPRWKKKKGEIAEILNENTIYSFSNTALKRNVFYEKMPLDEKKYNFYRIIKAKEISINNSNKFFKINYKNLKRNKQDHIFSIDNKISGKFEINFQEEIDPSRFQFIFYVYSKFKGNNIDFFIEGNDYRKQLKSHKSVIGRYKYYNISIPSGLNNVKKLKIVSELNVKAKESLKHNRNWDVRIIKIWANRIY